MALLCAVRASAVGEMLEITNSEKEGARVDDMVTDSRGDYMIQLRFLRSFR